MNAMSQLLPTAWVTDSADVSCGLSGLKGISALCTGFSFLLIRMHHDLARV